VVIHTQPTYEELEARIKKLEDENAALKGQEEPANDWHSMMYLLLFITLHGLPVDLTREIVIGAMPPRADYLIKKNDPGVDMKLEIFKIFLKMNVVEYKGPGDDLGEEELWQAVIYLAAQARKSLSQNEATSDDFTITLFREAKPIKLLKVLGEKAKADTNVTGIYHIEGWKVNVPMQIIVTGDLLGEEYAGFRAISKHPAMEDIRTLVEQGEKEQDAAMKMAYKDLLHLLSKVDAEAVEEAKRRCPEMGKTLMQIMEPEIKE
jgi:hypothetical protein